MPIIDVLPLPATEDDFVVNGRSRPIVDVMPLPTTEADSGKG